MARGDWMKAGGHYILLARKPGRENKRDDEDHNRPQTKTTATMPARLQFMVHRFN